MTPCEEKGYKVGDEFVVTKKTTFQKGARVRLSEDDGTNRPAFKGVGCKAEDGTDWNYIHLSRVLKVGNDDSIITRTNGQPFATEASARQQLTAKGLQGTHEVVPHEGGYALGPIQRMGEHVTLKPGDYVSTQGMTEGQYHAVARAFMGAGFESGEYPCKEELEGERAFGIDARSDSIFHGRPGSDGSDVKALCGRHLTIDQVLGATNAGNATPQPEESTMTADPIATLKQARQARDEAEQAYQQALEEAREFVGDGFELTEVGTDAAFTDQFRKSLAAAMQIPARMLFSDVEEDMSDPDNWKEGDVVECIEEPRDELEYFTVGKQYTVVRNDGSDAFMYIDDEGDRMWCNNRAFKFHHRPA